MNYCNIKYMDIANGTGIRVSLFVAGCSHHCSGCFNPETWDFTAGKPFDTATLDEILERISFPYCNGLTLLGGEPFEIPNQKALLPLVKRVRTEYPQKNIWAYTGFIYDRDLIPGGKAFCEETCELLDSLEVLVDGPFVESKKDVSLKFRGSSNQRLIDMPKTRETGKVVLCDEAVFSN